MVGTISLVLFNMLKITYTNCSVSVRCLVYISFCISSYSAIEYFEVFFSAITMGDEVKNLLLATIGISKVR